MSSRLVSAVFAGLAWVGSAAGQPAVPIASLGPQVGSPLPAFSASDQAGRSHTLQSLLGPKGALVVFSRSADW